MKKLLLALLAVSSVSVAFATENQANTDQTTTEVHARAHHHHHKHKLSAKEHAATEAKTNDTQRAEEAAQRAEAAAQKAEEAANAINSTTSEKANGGGVFTTIQAGNAFTTAATDNTSGVAGRVELGNMFNQYFGIVGGFTGTADVQNGAAFQITDISARGVLPISSAFSLHGSAGLAYLSYEQGSFQGPATKFALGAGADYNLTSNFGLTLNDYEYLNAGNAIGAAGGDINILMGGIKLMF